MRRSRERIAEADAGRIDGTTTARPIDEYEGTYRNYFFGDIVICNEPGGLYLEFAGSRRAELDHWHHETFRATWNDTVLEWQLSNYFNMLRFVTFQFGHDGKVSALELDGLGEFERVETEDTPSAPANDQ